MAYVGLRNARALNGKLALATALGLAAGLTVLGPPAAAAADIDVVIDRAKLVKVPEKASTIVIGNPLIADATIQSGGLMVITGKGYGLTNIIALDRGGKVLMDGSVEVRGPRDDVVVVYRGVNRETYSCLPFCERRITLGDGQAFFDLTIAQTATRNGLAAGATPASSSK
jgi:hypothetical protein